MPGLNGPGTPSCEVPVVVILLPVTVRMTRLVVDRVTVEKLRVIVASPTLVKLAKHALLQVMTRSLLGTETLWSNVLCM